MKIIFIVPNPRSMSLVAPVVSHFYNIFKQDNISMKFFDTTFYEMSKRYTNTDQIKQKILGVVPFQDELEKIEIEHKEGEQLFKDFREDVITNDYDVIMASAMESTFELTIEILSSIRDLGKPHILGGVFATFAPEICLNYEEIDIVCIGEGEKIIVPLVNKIVNKESLRDVPNICFKENGNIIKNKLLSPINIDEIPRFDASIYNEKRFYRAMAGKIYKMYPVETHRGCVYRCAFCSSPAQNKMYRNETGQIFHRKRSIKKVIEDIKYFIKDGAEYLFFWADNFFNYTLKEIDEFCELYKNIRIPFYAQSNPVNLTRDKVEKLIEVGLARVGIGIEHGNEKFRREVVKRDYTNKQAIDGIKILKDFDVSFSLNNIVGFPLETPELHQDTLELNRLLRPDSASCSIFTPFHGTPLRELAIEKGFLDPNILAPTNNDVSVLDMPQFTKDQILGKSRTFNLYLRLPKRRWSEIKQAERIGEGDEIWNQLRIEAEELISTTGYQD